MAGIGQPPMDSLGNGTHGSGSTTNGIPLEFSGSKSDYATGDLDELWKTTMSNFGDFDRIPDLTDVNEKISSFMDQREDTGDISDLGKDVTDLVRRNIPNLTDLSSRQIPALADIGKVILARADPEKDIPGLFDLEKDIPGLFDLEKDIPGLSDLRSKLSYFSHFGEKSAHSKDAITSFPAPGDSEKNEPAFNLNGGKDTSEFSCNDMSSALGTFGQAIPDLFSFENRDLASLRDLGEDMPQLSDIRQGISRFKDLSMDISDVDLDGIKDGIERVGGAIESLTGMSSTDLISKIPGADIFGLGQDDEDGSSDDDSNDFQSIFSDIRSIGGDFAEIISDSKQFFTQLGALVGVFGTLINTGSNVIDDYHNGKMASGIFNMILLMSVQIPTISAMLFVFLKDKVHLSCKGFRKVKEDLQELVEDIESFIGTDDEDEDRQDPDSETDSTTELIKEKGDNSELSNKWVPVPKIKIPPDKDEHDDFSRTIKIAQAGDDQRKSDRMESGNERKGLTNVVSKSLKKRKKCNTKGGLAEQGDDKENTETAELSKKRRTDITDHQAFVAKQGNKEDRNQLSGQSKKRKKSKIDVIKHGVGLRETSKPTEQKNHTEIVAKSDSSTVVMPFTSDSSVSPFHKAFIDTSESGKSSSVSPSNEAFINTSKSRSQVSQKTLQSRKAVSEICEEENSRRSAQHAKEETLSIAGHTQKSSEPAASWHSVARLQDRAIDEGSSGHVSNGTSRRENGFEFGGPGVKLKWKPAAPDKVKQEWKTDSLAVWEREASWTIVSHKRKAKMAIKHNPRPIYSRTNDDHQDADGQD